MSASPAATEASFALLQRIEATTRTGHWFRARTARDSNLATSLWRYGYVYRRPRPEQQKRIAYAYEYAAAGLDGASVCEGCLSTSPCTCARCHYCARIMVGTGQAPSVQPVLTSLLRVDRVVACTTCVELRNGPTQGARLSRALRKLVRVVYSGVVLMTAEELEDAAARLTAHAARIKEQEAADVADGA